MAFAIGTKRISSMWRALGAIPDDAWRDAIDMDNAQVAVSPDRPADCPSLFMTGERQYGFGDVVRIEVAGASEPATGTVEDFTLRVTRLRSDKGEVITVPNTQIVQVTNLSRDWPGWSSTSRSRPRSMSAGVTDILRHVGQDAYGDDKLRKLMLDPPTVMGVERIEVDTFSVRMLARTLPGAQFEVGRELRTRIASAFRDAGITVSAGLTTGRATGGA